MNTPKKPGWYWLLAENHREIVRVMRAAGCSSDPANLQYARVGSFKLWSVARFPEDHNGWSWGEEVPKTRTPSERSQAIVKVLSDVRLCFQQLKASLQTGATAAVVDRINDGLPLDDVEELLHDARNAPFEVGSDICKLFTLSITDPNDRDGDGGPTIEFHSVESLRDRKKEIINEALEAKDTHDAECHSIIELLSAGEVDDAWDEFEGSSLVDYLDYGVSVEEHAVAAKLFVPESARAFYQHWKPPFKYCPMGQQIQDSENNLLLDVRGWGYLTGKGSGALGLPEKQAALDMDETARRVVDLINRDAGL